MDWTTLGRWPLGGELVELKALVALLGFSRMVALAVATEQTRHTTLSLVPRVLADLGGAPQEILTDRDAVFVIGETSDKRAIFAPAAAPIGPRQRARSSAPSGRSRRTSCRGSPGSRCRRDLASRCAADLSEEQAGYVLRRLATYNKLRRRRFIEIKELGWGCWGAKPSRPVV